MPDKVSSNERKAETTEQIAFAVSSFTLNVGGVMKLLHFDREVLLVALTNIKALKEQLTKAGHAYAAQQATNTLIALERVKDHDSLVSRYQIIFNQAIVLLVSYFGSAVEELFKIGVASRLELDDDQSNLMAEDLKLTFKQIRDRGWNLREIAADLLVEKKDLTFQDMKSIAGAFREYIGITIDRDQKVNNIIAAQACRHVIVHAGHTVTPKMIYQLRDATPRKLKLELSTGEIVQFSPAEVELAATSMAEYIEGLAEKLRSRI